MGETHQITLELDRAMPGLKGKSRTPHMPEIRLKELRIELIGDGASPKELFRFERQALKRQNMTLAQAKRGRVDTVSIPKETGLRRGLHCFIPVEDFPRYRPGSIESENR